MIRGTSIEKFEKYIRNYIKYPEGNRRDQAIFNGVYDGYSYHFCFDRGLLRGYYNGIYYEIDNLEPWWNKRIHNHTNNTTS